MPINLNPAWQLIMADPPIHPALFKARIILASVAWPLGAAAIDKIASKMAADAVAAQPALQPAAVQPAVFGVTGLATLADLRAWLKCALARDGAAIRKRDYRVLEVAMALERPGWVLWEDLPPALWDRWHLPCKRDMGVDCAASDGSAAGQAKLLKPKSTVCFTAMGTFLLTAQIMGLRGAGQCVLGTSPLVKPHSAVALNGFVDHQVYYEARLFEILAAAWEGGPAAEPADRKSVV